MEIKDMNAAGIMFAPKVFTRQIINILSWILPFKYRGELFEGRDHYPRMILGKNANVSLSLLFVIQNDERFKQVGINISEAISNPERKYSFNKNTRCRDLQYMMTLEKDQQDVFYSEGDFSNILSFPDSMESSATDIHCASNKDIKNAIDYIYLVLIVFVRYVQDRFIGISRTNQGRYNRLLQINPFEVIEFGDKYIKLCSDFLRSTSENVVKKQYLKGELTEKVLYNSILQCVDKLKYIDENTIFEDIRVGNKYKTDRLLKIEIRKKERRSRK